jgi:dTDP-4-amino-4,6-dideoxygalactose transaminase
VPPADPRSVFLAHEPAIREVIDRVLLSGQYILGPEDAAFEREFAAYLGGGFAIGVGNGTEALELALRAAGVRPGDLVATVANTVSATVSAIEQIGAHAVFVEIEEDTMLMSPDALDQVLTLNRDRVRAVVPVHLYGHAADMTRICEISEAHGARVVEDAAQAHGAMIDGRKAGTFGALSSFSFYPTKNLGALGDAGGIFTRDAELDEKVRLLRQYGWRTRYISEIPGRNSRLDEIQAAVLRIKLPYLDDENDYRRGLAARYLERLADSSVTLPVVRPNAEHVWHQFAVRSPRKETIRAALIDEGISTGLLYPVPIHHQPAYLDSGASLPITEKACAEVFCLPCHPGIDLDDVDRVSEAVLKHSD